MNYLAQLRTAIEHLFIYEKVYLPSQLCLAPGYQLLTDATEQKSVTNGNSFLT